MALPLFLILSSVGWPLVKNLSGKAIHLNVFVRRIMWYNSNAQVFPEYKAKDGDLEHLLVMKRHWVRPFKRSAFKFCHLADCLLHLRGNLTFIPRLPDISSSTIQKQAWPCGKQGCGLILTSHWTAFLVAQFFLAFSQFHMQGWTKAPVCW
jgi:hypothetical protein